MKLSELARKKRILILGFGKEGHASLGFLKSKIPTAQVDTADQKDGADYLAKQHDYDLVIKSPGIRPELVTVPYTTATNIFFANTHGMVIGVTGSKGKSTTASLIYTILKKAGKPVHLMGNIGSPALDALSTETGPGQIYIFELSSYQLADIAYSPHIAVMTNFFPEHMDYHGGIEEYWEAKKRMLAYAGKNDFFVYNPAYPRLVRLAAETRARAVPFIAKLPFGKDRIPLLGKHNRDNVRAALTVANILRVPTAIAEDAVAHFHALPHRLEFVATVKGISFYDDAISTTPESTLAAIETFANVGAILLGGQNRGYDFSLLARRIRDRRIPVIILFPDSGAAIRRALVSVSYVPVQMLATSDMADAVRFVLAHAPKGSVCLLSTASPSYSIWKNFEEKGNLFAQFVRHYRDTV